jgi:hypothetical protein
VTADLDQPHRGAMRGSARGIGGFVAWHAISLREPVAYLHS